MREDDGCKDCIQREDCISCSNCKFEHVPSTEDLCYICEPGTEDCLWEAKE